MVEIVLLEKHGRHETHVMNEIRMADGIRHENTINAEI